MAVKMTEEYCWEESRQVLTPQQHGIPGVRVFGHNLNNRAVSPLGTHTHSGCLEIVLLVKGNQTYTVAGKTYPVSGGNVFISFPGEAHSSGGEPQNVSEIYWVQIDLEEQEGFLGLHQPWESQLRQRLKKLSQRVLYCGEELRRCMADSFWNTSSPDPCRQEYGRSQLISFLYGIILQEKARVLSLSEEIGAAVSYVRQNIREDISLETLAGCAGLSLSRFKARFKKETGMTPREYINQLKIREAKRMLQENQSVTWVALDLGFGSSNYFAVLFKKITLYTPSQYQKIMKEKESKDK